jgi:hypothetical protein
MRKLRRPRQLPLPTGARGPVALFLVCRTNAPTEFVSPHHVRD